VRDLAAPRPGARLPPGGRPPARAHRRGRGLRVTPADFSRAEPPRTTGTCRATPNPLTDADRQCGAPTEPNRRSDCGHPVQVGKAGASTGTEKPGADRSTWTISVYGTISVAVVVAEYASSSASRLALLVLGYGISLWLAHGYASVVSTERTTWRTALRHSWPVAEASLPALVVVGVAALVGWPNRVAVPLALLACLANLVAVQVAVLRGGGRRSRQRIAATIALDVVASVLVLAVLTLLR
jgi:hypothetical protein